MTPGALRSLSCRQPGSHLCPAEGDLMRSTGMSGVAGLETFSGFSVDDLARAKAFYATTLGLSLTDESDFGFGLVTASQTVFVYDKGEDHAPPTYTVLNFQT